MNRPRHPLALPLTDTHVAVLRGLAQEAENWRWSPAAVSRIQAAVAGREGACTLTLKLTADEHDVLHGILVAAVERGERDGTQDSPVATAAAQLLPAVQAHRAAIADAQRTAAREAAHGIRGLYR